VSAAGNPLYLHGSGASPACTPGTLSAAAGGRAVPCSFGDGIAYFAFTNLPAQTIQPGTWTFSLYWTVGVPVPLSNVTLSVGVVGAGVSCVGFAPGFSWSGTYGSLGGANPAVFSTAGPMVTITNGQTLCLKVDLSVEQDDANMIYDSAAAATRLVPPFTVVPESLLGLAGLALAIPAIAGRRRWRGWLAR
jgi:hypothetical protein